FKLSASLLRLYRSFTTHLFFKEADAVRVQRVSEFRRVLFRSSSRRNAGSPGGARPATPITTGRPATTRSAAASRKRGDRWRDSRSEERRVGKKWRIRACGQGCTTRRANDSRRASW